MQKNSPITLDLQERAKAPASGPASIMEWLAATFRWITLLGIVISLGTRGRLEGTITLALLLPTFWFALFTIFVALNRSGLHYRVVGLVGDLVVSLLLFSLTGLLDGPLGWVGLLPVLTASLYFPFKGSFFVSGISLVLQGLLASTRFPLSNVGLFLATITPLYLGVWALLSWLNRQFLQQRGLASKPTQPAHQEVEHSKSKDRRTLYHLIFELSATLSYPRVLELALDLTTEALGTTTSSIENPVSAVLLFSKSEGKGADLHVALARRFTPSDQRVTLAGASGLVAQAIEEGKPHLSKDPGKDPELSRFIALQACAVVFCLPLRIGLETYGVMLFAHPDPNFFNDERREILEIAAQQVVIAIQNARLYQHLELEKERMMEIQEDTRKKMARDLHDGPTQSVSAIAMRVNFARRLMDRDTKAAAEELYKIEELARRTTKEIRHMLFTLRPLVLESQGLVAALESMAEKMHETYNQNVIIQADAEVVSALELGKQGVIFYIAEEAINNARKHAKAAHIWVRLKTLEEDLSLLEIEDDGVGFNPSAMDASYENRGSLGMVNMRERTELVNGVLHLESAEGQGTRIQVLIPLTEAAADRIRRGL